MKTCPNPKCKATGIPDNAKFCPVCGQLILSLNQLRKQKENDRNRLRKEAEQAWEEYPDKPRWKMSPYSILGLVTPPVYIIIVLKLELGEGSASFDIILSILFVIEVAFVLLHKSYNNRLQEKARENFIANYISEHKGKA